MDIISPTLPACCSIGKIANITGYENRVKARIVLTPVDAQGVLAAGEVANLSGAPVPVLPHLIQIPSTDLLIIHRDPDGASAPI